MVYKGTHTLKKHAKSDSRVALAIARQTKNAYPTQRARDGIAKVGASLASVDLTLSMPGRIAALLERSIFEGLYQPGEWLREVDLASSLGVSRTPLREAFHILERKGLLEIMPRRGVRVRTITAQEMQWLMMIRVCLDGLAAWLAATNASEEQLTRLAHVVDKQRAAVTGKTPSQFGDLGSAFHALIYEASANPRLVALHRSLAAEGALYRMRDLSQPGGMENSLVDHERLLSAIRRRDAEQARALAERHIGRIRDQLLRELTRAGSRQAQKALANKG